MDQEDLENIYEEIVGYKEHPTSFGEDISYDFIYVRKLSENYVKYSDKISTLENKEYNEELSLLLDKIFYDFAMKLEKINKEYKNKRECFLELKNLANKHLLLNVKTDHEEENSRNDIITPITEHTNNIKILVKAYDGLFESLTILKKSDLKSHIKLIKEIYELIENLKTNCTESEKFIKKFKEEYYGYYDEILKYYFDISNFYENFAEKMEEVEKTLLKNNREPRDNLTESEYFKTIEKLIKHMDEFSSKLKIAIKKYSKNKEDNEELKKLALKNLKYEHNIREVDYEFITNSMEKNIKVINEAYEAYIDLSIYIENLKYTIDKMLDDKDKKVMSEFINQLEKTSEQLGDFKVEITDHRYKIEEIANS